MVVLASVRRSKSQYFLGLSLRFTKDDSCRESIGARTRESKTLQRANIHHDQHVALPVRANANGSPNPPPQCPASRAPISWTSRTRSSPKSVLMRLRDPTHPWDVDRIKRILAPRISVGAASKEQPYVTSHQRYRARFHG